MPACGARAVGDWGSRGASESTQESVEREEEVSGSLFTTLALSLRPGNRSLQDDPIRGGTGRSIRETLLNVVPGLHGRGIGLPPEVLAISGPYFASNAIFTILAWMCYYNSARR